MDTNTLVGLGLTILSVNVTPPNVVTQRVRGPGKPPSFQQFGTNHSEFVHAMQEFQRTNTITGQMRTNAGRTNFVVGIVGKDGTKIPLLVTGAQGQGAPRPNLIGNGR